MESKLWNLCNRTLIAKVLSELHFEEKLLFEALSFNRFCLQGKNKQWLFTAQKSIWGMLIIDAQSLVVSKGDLLVSELLIDIQELIEISDIHLSGLLEEMQQTLYSDTQFLDKQQSITAQQLIALDEVSRQRYLNAHPKAIANKGRLGWGHEELLKYSPELGEEIQLEYIAVDKSLCEFGFTEALSQQQLLSSILGPQAYSALIAEIPAQLSDYLIFAVHPWQYQRFIRVQYAQYFADGSAVYLGKQHSKWVAQQSIRTLSPVEKQINYDVKTALTILNTSCYRGIPGKFIQQGPVLSAWLAKIAEQDPLLKVTGLKVQQEVAGVFCSHPQQQQIQGAYRYNEMLGCIWRETAQSVIAPEQRALSMATLMQQDSEGDSAIVALIESSSLSAEQWLKKLFQHVVIPLYHLMCQYGVALVAHGQNITLVLQDNQPAGCIIKDFHGDLRLIDQAFPELESLDKSVQENLMRLPSEYLIHDLITGHFVTVLRFVSPKLNALSVSEEDFYYWLALEIKSYQALHPQLNKRFLMFDLLKEQIEKICVNRVRFKIGYGDSEERPLPELGTPIKNPLCAKVL